MSNVTKKKNIPYTLDEALTIINMLDEGLSLNAISEITANSPDVTTRTAHGLRYKFKEGDLTKKDSSDKYTRSLRQFDSNEALFTHFKEIFVSEDDVSTRIINFKNKMVVVDKKSVQA